MCNAFTDESYQKTYIFWLKRQNCLKWENIKNRCDVARFSKPLRVISYIGICAIVPLVCPHLPNRSSPIHENEHRLVCHKRLFSPGSISTNNPKSKQCWTKCLHEEFNECIRYPDPFQFTGNSCAAITLNNIARYAMHLFEMRFAKIPKASTARKFQLQAERKRNANRAQYHPKPSARLYSHTSHEAQFFH